jgi:heptosyltransferase-1
MAQRIELPAEPSRILLVKPSSLGDVVHTLPVLALLRRRFPRARITWMLAPACAGLLEGHPLLDEVLVFDRPGLGAAWRRLEGWRELWSFDARLRSGRFDLVLDLQGLLRSSWLAWRTGAPRRIGLACAREGATLLYTHRVGPATLERHAVERYLDVAEALGCGRRPVEFPFHVTAEDRAAVAQLVPPGEGFAVLLPGANWPTKRWPAERFAELAQRLDRRLGLRTVVAGGRDVEGIAQAIGLCRRAVTGAEGPAGFPTLSRTGAGETPAVRPSQAVPDPVINLAGRTTLRQLVALLERATLVIANDSGPMHIAAALGRPLVAIFGPTNPVRTGPYGRPDCVLRLDLACVPCYSRRCSHGSCLQWLEVESVLAAAERAVGEGDDRRRVRGP